MDKRLKRSSRDLLSDLPLCMIHCILERVPIRNAVKTSILSRQWRYKWTTLPQLAFDDECVSFSSSEPANGNTRLKHFINQALFHHKKPIHNFKLQGSSMETFDYIDQWLLFLSRNGIRMLTLNQKDYKELLHVNSSLYSCHNLTHLDLSHCEIPPPTFKGFLCLRCLVLRFNKLPSIVESFVANCPPLVELTLSYCFGSLVLRIHAPNLRYFYLRGAFKEIYLYAPLLAKMMVVNKRFTADQLQQKSLVSNYTKFLGGFTHLEELSGDLSFLEYLSIGIESCSTSLTFHHLRVIELSRVHFHDIKVVSVVICLITGAPNLQKLKIIRHYNYNSPYPSEVASICKSFWDSECAPNFTFERFKVIEMKNVRGRVDEMKFIKFLLASSAEKMICEPFFFTTE